MTTETIEYLPTSATLEGVSDNLYLRLWRGVPRELGFLLLTMPIATVGFSVSIALFSAGVGTLVTFFIGIFLLAGMLYASRGFGTLELVRLEWAGRPRIARPEWPREPGFWGWVRSLFGNGHYWLYTLHTTLINYVISLVSWTVVVTWVAGALGGTTYWFWGRFIPEGNSPWFLSRWLFQVFGDRSVDWVAAGLDWRMLDSVFQLVLGIAFLATIPFVTRGLVLLHEAIARGVLAAFASDALRREVTSLSVSRGAAISAEGQSLRRLERDIHDGPQQRLVRLQMDLAAAERQLDSDPDAARALIEEARERSQEALDELRALSRGFAPPILLDRGLVAALESLASRSSLPVTVTSALDPSVELPQEIERNAYFVASELVANAAKHSGAGAVEVTVSLRRVPEGDDWWLDVAVADDGHGGAASVDGHGLAGLEERLRGLGGTLELDSPAGGPTVATGHLPITY
jgi:signal transduction histidine kinase